MGEAEAKAARAGEGEIDVYAQGHAIKPKTEGQKRYIDAMSAAMT